MNKFLTVKEAAILLRLSRPTIDRLIARGDIPSYKIGGKRLFDQDELIEWVKSHRDDRPRKMAKKEGGRQGKKGEEYGK